MPRAAQTARYCSMRAYFNLVFREVADRFYDVALHLQARILFSPPGHDSSRASSLLQTPVPTSPKGCHLGRGWSPCLDACFCPLLQFDGLCHVFGG